MGDSCKRCKGNKIRENTYWINPFLIEIQNKWEKGKISERVQKIYKTAFTSRIFLSRLQKDSREKVLGRIKVKEAAKFV